MKRNKYRQFVLWNSRSEVWRYSKKRMSLAVQHILTNLKMRPKLSFSEGCDHMCEDSKVLEKVMHM